MVAEREKDSEIYIRRCCQLSSDARSFEDFKARLLSQSALILDRASAARFKAAEVGAQFINDNAVVLVHAYSRVVMSLLQYAANVQNKRFKVYVTEGRPGNDGYGY